MLTNERREKRRSEERERGLGRSPHALVLVYVHPSFLLLFCSREIDDDGEWMNFPSSAHLAFILLVLILLITISIDYSYPCRILRRRDDRFRFLAVVIISLAFSFYSFFSLKERSSFLHLFSEGDRCRNERILEKDSRPRRRKRREEWWKDRRYNGKTPCDSESLSMFLSLFFLPSLFLLLSCWAFCTENARYLHRLRLVFGWPSHSHIFVHQIPSYLSDLAVSLSVYLSICLYLSVYRSVSIDLSICLYLSIYRSVSIYLFVCFFLSFYLPGRTRVYPFICDSTDLLSFHLSLVS